MNLNPFTKDIAALEHELNKNKTDLSARNKDLSWFNGFKPEQAIVDIKRAERMSADVETKIQQVEHDLTHLESSKKRLADQASLGIDPRYWFSSERAIAKRQLAEVEREIEKFLSKLGTLKIERAKADELESKARVEIERARNFDPLLAKAVIVALQANIDRIEPQLAHLRQRSNDLDKVLQEPQQSLEANMLRRDQLEWQISAAADFDQQLKNARDNHARSRIHVQCEKTLGDDKPQNVLRKSKGELRSIEGNIAKLKKRIDRLIGIATRDIRHIVIDGNNLCYEGKRFLKLAALEVLVPLLTHRYKVTLIFDASIRSKLELSSQDIANLFPQVERVHIVATRRKADETILAIASDDPHSFVLSNDRFADYPEKRVVKAGRILRHEIVDQFAYIHDLQIEAKFKFKPNAEAA